MTRFDVIVLGTGGVGSSAAFHLARRGCKVLGLDRFPGGHAEGSSHGQTRIIRKAYFEHPDYVPLLNRSYELWHELEALCDERLFHQVGLVEIGPPDGVVVPGVLESARKYGLQVERISPGEFTDRFPGFVVPDGSEVVFEREAGYLLVERCVLAHLARAQAAGADLRTEEVVAWESSDAGVNVRTPAGSYSAAKLVITAGPWAGQLMADSGIGFRVLRKHLHWFACTDRCYVAEHGCPGFFYEVPEGYFYGFPAMDNQGVKVAEHSGGLAIQNPVDDDKSVETQDLDRVAAFVRDHLPGVSTRTTGHAVCYYTMSADEHFVVDKCSFAPNVVFAAGLSGHGFKFTSALGEVLADLAIDGRTSQPIDFLRANRPTISS